MYASCKSENRFAVVSVVVLNIQFDFSLCYHRCCSFVLLLFAYPAPNATRVSSENDRDRLISEWFVIQQIDKLWHETVSGKVHRTFVSCLIFEVKEISI